MSALITLGNLTIDRDRYEAAVEGARIELTYVEFELLCHLAKNAGKVLGRSRLLEDIWNERLSRGEDRKLTVHMSRLRKKMRGSRPWHIETITKRGYALVDHEEARMRIDPKHSGRQSPSMGGLA